MSKELNGEQTRIQSLRMITKKKKTRINIHAVGLWKCRLLLVGGRLIPILDHRNHDIHTYTKRIMCDHNWQG